MELVQGIIATLIFGGILILVSYRILGKYGWANFWVQKRNGFVEEEGRDVLNMSNKVFRVAIVVMLLALAGFIWFYFYIQGSSF